MAGSRDIFHTFFPVQTVQKAIDTGLLPKLNQAAAPAGFQLSYKLDPLGPVSNVNAGIDKLKTLGGLQVVQTVKPVEESILTQIMSAVSGLASFFTPISAAGFTLTNVGKPNDAAPAKLLGFTSLQPTGGNNMAFQDGDTGFFGGFGDVFGGLNNILQANGQNLLNLGLNAANSYISSSFAPQPVSYGGGGAAVPTMAAVPAIVGAGRAVATVGRGFFNRFPSLATSMQALRNRGANVTRSSLYSAMRRFGPEMLVSGGILTAAAVSELAVAGPGRRRMNPGNVKALRRAHRRMRSFHKVCVDNDQLIRRRRK